MEKIERTYNVPLRKEWLKAPRYKRAKKAVTALREFLARTFRVEIVNVKIGIHANLLIWKHGMQNPPHHIKVHAVKDDNMVKAELEGIAYEDYKPAPKKEEKKPGIAGKIQELKETAGKKEEKKEAKEEKKPEKKEEHKEVKKEKPAEKKPEHKPEPKKEAKNEASKEEKPAKEHKPEHKHEEKKAEHKKEEKPAKKSSKK